MENIKIILRKTLSASLYKRFSSCWRKIIDLPLIQFPLCFLLDRRFKQFPPVFVYQMGKVVSRSIYRSLSGRYPGSVFHGHRFNEDDPQWNLRRLYQYGVVEKKPLLVICPIREPIGRSVSSFFHNFEQFMGVPCIKSKLSLDELKKHFLFHFKNRNNHLTWFNNNILKNFGIDVYASPFPKEGTTTYFHNNIKLLIMRMETDDRKKTEEIRKFLGLHDFQLYNSNLGNEKEHKDIYRTFKAEVKFPEQYLSEICKSKFFRHFYSDDFIERTKKKWRE